MKKPTKTGDLIKIIDAGDLDRPTISDLRVKAAERNNALQNEIHQASLYLLASPVVAGLALVTIPATGGMALPLWGLFLGGTALVGTGIYEFLKGGEQREQEKALAALLEEWGTDKWLKIAEQCESPEQFAKCLQKGVNSLLNDGDEAKALFAIRQAAADYSGIPLPKKGSQPQTIPTTATPVVDAAPMPSVEKLKPIAEAIAESVTDPEWEEFNKLLRQDKKMAMTYLVRAAKQTKDDLFARFGPDGLAVWAWLGLEDGDKLAGMSLALPGDGALPALSSPSLGEDGVVSGSVGVAALRSIATNVASTLWIGKTGGGKTITVYTALAALVQQSPDLDLRIVSQKNDSFCGANQAGLLHQFDQFDPATAIDQIEWLYAIYDSRRRLPEHERGNLSPALLLLDDWSSIAGDLNEMGKHPLVKNSNWSQKLKTILTVGRAFNVKLWICLQSPNLDAIGIKGLDASLRQNFNIWIQGNQSVDPRGGVLDSTSVLQMGLNNEGMVPNAADRNRLQLEFADLLPVVKAEHRPMAYCSVENRMMMLGDLRQNAAIALNFKQSAPQSSQSSQSVTTVLQPVVTQLQTAPMVLQVEPSTPALDPLLDYKAMVQQVQPRQLTDEEKRDLAIAKAELMFTRNGQLYALDLANAAQISAPAAEQICQMIAARKKAVYLPERGLVQ
jgi:hypothetical protein